MLLAIDTATRTASIALYNADGAHAELFWRTRANHTVELTVQIAHLLALARIGKNDLQAIGVASGPGSFTGLRVGMSVAKGLAWSLRVPILAVPTLDAVAHAFALQPLPVWAILAAGRGRYSIARYVAEENAMRCASEIARVDARGVADVARERAERALFAGEIDPALAEILRASLGDAARIASPAQNARRAGFLAELAWARWTRGETDDVRALAPLYASEKIPDNRQQTTDFV